MLYRRMMSEKLANDIGRTFASSLNGDCFYHLMSQFKEFAN